MISADNSWIFYLLIFASLILGRLPVIGIYFRIVNTLVHETGHALVALILAGRLSRIELFSDSSGTAKTLSKNKFCQFLISIAGYPASSVVAYLCFLLIKNGHYMLILYALSGLTIINLILFVRNKFGIFWLITYAAILFLIFNFGNQMLRYCAAVFFSSIILTDSILSAMILLVLSLRDGKKAGDATNLKAITKIPAFFWALMFNTFAFLCLYKIATIYVFRAW